MAEFDFKVNLIDIYFSFLEKGSYFRQTPLIEVSRVKIGLAVLATLSSQSMKRFKKRKKMTNTYICWAPPTRKFFRETKFS